MKTLSYITCFALGLASFSSFAEPSTEHSGKASKHSALAASHGVAGSGQVASAAVAVPLVVGGSLALSVGAASVEAGAELSKVASSKTSHVKQTRSRALEVTEITITVDRSPAQAMQEKH